MAAASSSSGGHWEYDVFLSFRGEDTRRSFVCHLHKALEQKTINAYIDSQDLDKGKRISELLTAIENSRISIVVLSQNYASSTWCLKELAKILGCMVSKKQIVVPIFYQVDPSHIRKTNGTFAQAFAKHGENPNLDREELESWRSALTTIADLSGWDSSKYEDDGKLIEKIVESAHKELIHTSYSKVDGLVGMGSHIEEMYSRLCLEVNDVRVVGIWGMGGLGKTTIARAVYEEIACQYEYSCFLNNVKEAFMNKREVQMQEELLSRLSKEKVQSVDLNRGRNMILKRLGTKKVLVVLDDVETFAQIVTLLGELHAFGEGSRIIVTTRNKQSLSGVNETYQPRYLSGVEALDLFMKYAFKTNQPSRDYDHLLRRATDYAHGLPLALKVLGAFLDKKSVWEWEAVLEKLKKIPQIEIQDVLRTSIDGLDDLEKDIFLDIACVFRKSRKHVVTELLDSFGFFPLNGLRVLVDRALITISVYDEVDMHDLVQDMGREIVRLESPREPGKRSRLWTHEDVYHILTQNTATDAVECLMLDLSKSKVDLCINKEAFVRMKKLRLLIIHYSHPYIFDSFVDCIWTKIPEDGCKQVIKGDLDLEFLSHELRFLLWHRCPLKSLPSNFIPKNLVRIDMCGSHIRELWEGMQPLQNLKVILLSHCRYLVKIPDLTEAINLEGLFLDGCSSLCELHSSIFALQKLRYLSLRECKELMILPSRIHMKSLRFIDLSGCSNLEKFPEISDGMPMLTQLRLAGTSIKELPSSINNLSGLKVLNIEGCTELKSLPICIHLSFLRTLNLEGCSSLEKFPEISGIMKNLSVLRLDGTAIKGLPSSIDLLEGLEILSMRNCKSLEFLPASICNLTNLTRLDLSGCSALHNLPEKFGDLKSLRWLDALESGIKHFPLSLLRLYKQHNISDTVAPFSGSSLIKFFSDTVAPFSWSSLIKFYGFACLVHLDLSDCNLMVLPDGIGDLSSLKTLKLCRNNLESLPVTMDRLGCLARLQLEACKRLKSIPELSSIIHIDAHCCTALETISAPKIDGGCGDFRFSNCFRVPQTIFRDIVETHALHQDNLLRLLCFNMCLPGSEVPEWFNFRDTGCSLSLHVPPDSFNNELLGFAICIAINFSGARHDVSNIYARCSFTSRRNHGEHFHRFDVLRQSGTQRFLKSDHLFMAYIPWFRYGWITEDGLDAIKIVAETGTYSPTEDCFTNSFGVRLVYANHEEMQNSVTRTTVHVDGQSVEDAAQQWWGCSNEGGVTGLGTSFFPDQLEIRKSDTVAVSSESGEGRGKCQTLELLPEPQTESKEAEEITVVVEHGEGCRVLGSVCSCLSLSGCTEREGDRVPRFADDGEISKLGSHSGLVVPDSQKEGKDEEEMMGEESLAVRRLLGPLRAGPQISRPEASFKNGGLYTAILVFFMSSVFKLEIR